MRDQMTSQNFISQKREGCTKIRKSPSFPLCQRGIGSVLTALLILSGPPVTFAASGNNTFTPTNIFAPLSTPAHAIYQNASLVLIICAAIFLVVGGLLAYTIFRFRRRPEHENLEPPQVYGSNQIELAWTVIPILIVLVITLATARTIYDVQGALPPPGR
jgi:heme/copper-type cytochrome/quinol oxidase subunit 2